MRWSSLLLALAFTYGVANAQTAILTEDFEGRTSRWILPAEAEIADGVLRITAQGDGIPIVDLPDVMETNFDLSFTAINDVSRGFASFNVWIRSMVNDEDFVTDAYVLTFLPAESEIYLEEIANGDWQDTLASAETADLSPRSRTYRLVVNGTNLTVFVDGRQVLTADLPKQRSGRVGLGVGTYTDEVVPAVTTFDDIVLVRPQATGSKNTRPGSVQINPTAEATPTAPPQASPTPLPQPSPTPAPRRLTIQNWDGDAEDIIAELVERNLVTGTPQLWLRLPEAFMSGGGRFFYPIGRDTRYTNMVVGADMTFRRGSSTAYENCAISTRLVVDNNGYSLGEIVAGLDSDNFFFMYERENVNSIFDPIGVRDDATAQAGTYRVLLILMGREARYFVNGQQILTLPLERQDRGKLAVSLTGGGTNALCRADNFWAYEFD
jgi:hypothetical protein